MDDWSLLFFGLLAWPVVFCSWVNIAMVAASLGMMLCGKRAEWVLFSSVLAITLVLFLIQGDDLVFAGGLISSFVGLCAAGLFLSLMLERKDSGFYNTLRAVSFIVLIPATCVNLLVFGASAFVLIGSFLL